MENNIIKCSRCGRKLAQLIDAAGQRRRIKPCEGVSVHIQKNALGEDLGWLRCRDCKVSERFDTAHWLGNH